MSVAVAIYCLLVGTLMIVWWALEIRAGVLRRTDRTRAEIGLHLAAELVTAATLLAGGTALLDTGPPGVALVGLGMLAYTVIQSPGYFIARRELPPVVMFAILLACTICSIAWLLTA